MVNGLRLLTAEIIGARVLVITLRVLEAACVWPFAAWIVAAEGAASGDVLAHAVEADIEGALVSVVAVHGFKTVVAPSHPDMRTVEV